jgi:hypothetical protein
MAQLGRRRVHEVDALEDDLARGRLLEPQDQPADRGLAAAGLADQPERLARRMSKETSSTARTDRRVGAKGRRRPRNAWS